MKDRIAAQVCEMMHGLTVVNMRTMGLVLKTLQESACPVSAAMGKTSSGAPTFPIAGGARQGMMIQDQMNMQTCIRHPSSLAACIVDNRCLDQLLQHHPQNKTKKGDAASRKSHSD